MSPNKPVDTPIKNSSKLDLLFVALITIATYFIAAYFELAENWLEWTNTVENYQLDELIFVLLASCCSLIWFSHRRHQDLQKMLEHNRTISDSLENKNNEVNTLLSENRELINHITQAREQERNDLATELHDIFGQHLAAIEVNSTVASRYAEGNEKLSPILTNIQVSAHTLSRVTRSKLRSIKPPNLEAIGLTDSIKELIAQWTRSFPNYDLEMDIAVNDDWINYEIALTIYRCLQEGLSNIVKHAKADKINIKLMTRPDATGNKTLWFELNDNGIGIPSNLSLNGLGLIGMRERLNAISGQINIYPIENGTILNIKIPLETVTLHKEPE